MITTKHGFSLNSGFTKIWSPPDLPLLKQTIFRSWLTAKNMVEQGEEMRKRALKEELEREKRRDKEENMMEQIAEKRRKAVKEDGSHVKTNQHRRMKVNHCNEIL